MHKSTRRFFLFFDIFWIAFIVTAALVIRLKLSSLNFWQDEPYTVAAVKGILQHGVPRLSSGALYTRAIPYNYVSALVVSLFGYSELVFRSVSITLGIGSIIFIYYFFKSISTRSVAALVAFILALSPWHITYSFFARPYMMQIILYFLILWNYYRFFVTKKNLFLIVNIPLLFFAGFLSPSTVLFFFVILYVLYIHISSKAKKNLTVIVLLCAQLLAILPGISIPGAYLAAETARTPTPTPLVVLRTLIMPNLYFWKTLFLFFPIGSVLFVASAVYFWFKDKRFFVFPFFVMSSFIFLSVINPFGNLQPRYVSVFMLPYFVSVFYFLYVTLQKKSVVYFVLYALVVSDVFLFPHILNMGYGKELKKTMLISHSWTTFPDIKSQTEYVNSHYKKGDIVISLQPKGHTEVYARFKTNYLLRTENYLSEGHVVGGVMRDDYYGIPIITSLAQLNQIVKKSSARTWIISSKSENPSVKHIDEKTLLWITKNARIVYTGAEKYSKVYEVDFMQL